jgi:hypothetical protein
MTAVPIKQINDEFRWFLLQRKRKEINASLAFARMRAREIEPILIKGLAAAWNYPLDCPRHFNDTDLAVSSEDFPRATKLLNSEEFLDLNIDLHDELRSLDSVPWADLFGNSRIVDIDGTTIRILRPEDHLRVLCVHWLLDGGARKERLWDIFHAIDRRPLDFDWDRCLNVVSDRRRKWIIYAILITNHYLGLKIDDLPFAEKYNLPKWMQKCIENEWKAGENLEPVLSTVNNPRKLVRQIIKRIPPNPIRSTIEMEGSLDGHFRLFYQMGSMIKMLPRLGLAARMFTRRLSRIR